MPGKKQEVPGLFMRSGKLYQLYRSYLNIIFAVNVQSLSNKMDATIQMTMFDNVNHRHTIYLKFGDRSFPFLTILEYEPVSA